jgi:hypothetical protein
VKKAWILGIELPSLLISRRRYIPIRKRLVNKFLNQFSTIGIRYVPMSSMVSTAISSPLTKGRLLSLEFRIAEEYGRLIAI